MDHLCGESLQPIFALFLTLCKITYGRCALKEARQDIFLILMKTKYEGCCSLTKQIEITLDLLTNGFKSSNSILQLRGNFKISMMIALYVRWSTITILHNAKIFFLMH